MELKSPLPISVGKSILINMGLNLNLSPQDHEMLVLNADVMVNGGDTKLTPEMTARFLRRGESDRTKPSEKTGTRPNNYSEDTEPHITILPITPDNEITQPAIKILPEADITTTPEFNYDEFWDWVDSNDYMWNRFTRNGLLKQIDYHRAKEVINKTTLENYVRGFYGERISGAISIGDLPVIGRELPEELKTVGMSGNRATSYGRSKAGVIANILEEGFRASPMNFGTDKITPEAGVTIQQEYITGFSDSRQPNKPTIINGREIPAATSIYNDTSFPDAYLGDSNGKFKGVVEVKTYTPAQIREIALKLQGQNSTSSTNLPNVEGLQEFGNNILRNMEGRDLRNEMPVVLRFPQDARDEDLLVINEYYQAKGLNVFIQKLPFTSSEIQDHGMKVIRENFDVMAKVAEFDKEKAELYKKALA